MNTSNMSSKEIIKDLLLRLLDEVSLHQIAQEIEFIAAIEGWQSLIAEKASQLSK